MKNGTNLSHQNLNDIILPNNSVDSISPEKTRQNLMGVMFVHVNSSNNMLFTRLELKNIFSVSANFYGFILIVIYLRTNIKKRHPDNERARWDSYCASNDSFTQKKWRGSPGY